ncbi:MAG: peroxiredoxin [Sphingomonadaceae bacterium]
MVDVGDMAPNCSFTALDGSAKAMADYRGKALVIYFYPKNDTSGCTKEAQEFTALMPAFAAAGTTILGVSRDSEKSHAKFIAKYDLGVELGSDVEGGVSEAFGVWVEKSMYGKKYMGIERSTFLIDASGKIAHVWRKVKVPGHAAAVLAAAQTVGG